MSARVVCQGRRYAVSLASRIAILELVNMAQAKVTGGVKPGDLRWSHPARDFYWHDVRGARVYMDAYQFITLARRVMEHSEERRLRAPAPIPLSLNSNPIEETSHAFQSCGP